MSDASDDPQVDPAKLLGEKCAQAVQRAVMYAAARCDSEADAMKRLRIEQIERSRRRLPRFVVWLDGERVWSGAYERDADNGEKFTWLERWHSYAPASFDPSKRWLGEPEHSAVEVLTDEHGKHWVAKVRRPSGNPDEEVDGIGTMFVARATTWEGAVEAVYVEIDKQTALPSESETVQ